MSLKICNRNPAGNPVITCFISTDAWVYLRRAYTRTLTYVKHIKQGKLSSFLLHYSYQQHLLTKQIQIVRQIILIIEIILKQVNLSVSFVKDGLKVLVSYHGPMIGEYISADVYLLTIVSISYTAGLSVVDLSAKSKGAYPCKNTRLYLAFITKKRNPTLTFFYNPVYFCFNPKSPGGSI